MCTRITRFHSALPILPGALLTIGSTPIWAAVRDSVSFQGIPKTSGVYNTACGWKALVNNTTGCYNTADGADCLASNGGGNDNTAMGTLALSANSTGNANTAVGSHALSFGTTGDSNTAIGYGAGVSTGALTNATAIRANAFVNASNKIRLGNNAVTVIEGQAACTFTSDENQKENFQPVNGDEVLQKIGGLSLTSWN